MEREERKCKECFAHRLSLPTPLTEGAPDTWLCGQSSELLSHSASSHGLREGNYREARAVPRAELWTPVLPLPGREDLASGIPSKCDLIVPFKMNGFP